MPIDWQKFLRKVPSQQGSGRIKGRQIYILPTGYGLLFGMLLTTLLIASINYANNPAFLLTFLLAGVFIQSIFQTWKNLLHLQIRETGCEGVFAGDTAYPGFELSDASGRGHYSIQLAFDEQPSVVCDCPPGETRRVEVPCATRRRGLLHCGRLTIETRFPLGLLRAWCYFQPSKPISVWPNPAPGQIAGYDPDYRPSSVGDRGVGTDDFVGNRNYRNGDQPSHINWKALAGEKGVLVKEYGGDRVDLSWLDFDQVEAPDPEQRLRILAWAVEDLYRQGRYFGLRLGEVEIAPQQGLLHRQHCLDALAAFGAQP